jgi:transposase
MFVSVLFLNTRGMLGMIVMDSKTQLTVDIIAKVVEGRIAIANAAKLLSKSRRTIERYVKRYQQVGIQFAVHGNSGKPPPNKTPTSIKNGANLNQRQVF